MLRMPNKTAYFKLKTWRKQLLGYLALAFTLPSKCTFKTLHGSVHAVHGMSLFAWAISYASKMFMKLTTG